MTKTFADFTMSEALPEATRALALNLDDGIFETTDKDTGRILTAAEAMEREDPSGEYAGSWLAGTNALQRQLLALGIRTQDDPTAGIPASTVGEFFDAGGGRGAVLFPAWLESFSRAVNSVDRFYMSTAAGDDATNSLRPFMLARNIVADALQNSILPLLVGTQELGDGKPYLGFFMSEDSTKTTPRRITEFSPPAVYSISGSDRTNRFVETGIELQISYKALREYALPALQTHLAWINQRNTRAKEQVAYETHYSGDGNSAAATNTNVSALTSGVAGTVTHGDLLEWLRLYEADGNYMPTIAIGTSAVVHKIDISNTGTANHMTFAGLQAVLAGEGATPERRTFPPMFARSYATANKLLAADAKTLRMKYTPLLVERDRVISGRFEKIVISEETAFDHLREGGRRTLDVEN